MLPHSGGKAGEGTPEPVEVRIEREMVSPLACLAPGDIGEGIRMLGIQGGKIDVRMDRADAERGEVGAAEMPQVVGDDVRPDMRRSGSDVPVLRVIRHRRLAFLISRDACAGEDRAHLGQQGIGVGLAQPDFRHVGPARLHEDGVCPADAKEPVETGVEEGIAHEGAGEHVRVEHNLWGGHGIYRWSARRE